MTIDADEIARLRANLDKGFRPTRRESLALLDELEKARTEGQRQYDHNVGQIAKFAAVEAERDRLAVLLRESKKCVEQYVGEWA